jgi:hypothetical protein
MARHESSRSGRCAHAANSARKTSRSTFAKSLPLIPLIHLPARAGVEPMLPLGKIIFPSGKIRSPHASPVSPDRSTFAKSLPLIPPNRAGLEGVATMFPIGKIGGHRRKSSTAKSACADLHPSRASRP